MLAFEQEKVLNIVKILRGNNNARYNCTHLASDLIDYFKSGIKPTKASSVKSSTLNDFNVIINIDWIKKENDEYLGIIQSTVCRDTSSISNIPYNIEYNKENHIYNLEEEIYNVDTYTQKSSRVDTINDVLKSEDPSFGFINLGRCGEYVENCGHMLVYYSIENIVWYIDCQLYDGLNKKDNGCIFNNLLDTYDFACNNKIHIDTFSEYIFYISMNFTPLSDNIQIKKEIINKQNNNSCKHEKRKSSCILCTPKLLCMHKKRKHNCILCTPGIFCEHKKKKSNCHVCSPQSFCKHKKLKTNCHECTPQHFCQHKKKKAKCFECGGSSLCKHKKERTKCIKCGGNSICKHKKIKRNCSECGGQNICEHKKQKNNCHECSPQYLCKHRKRKGNCQECSPQYFCEHKKRKYGCSECNGNSLCEDNYKPKNLKMNHIDYTKDNKLINKTLNKEFDMMFGNILEITTSQNKIFKTNQNII